MDIYSVIGVLLAPIAAAILFGVIGGGIRLAIARFIPDCWLKRQILAERIKTRYSRANDRIAQESATHPNGWRDCLKTTALASIPNPTNRR